MPDAPPTAPVLDQIARRSSAEEIFDYLCLPYDPQVVNVARLHVMKRFGTYLQAARLSALEDDAAFLAARDCLLRAYEDFVGTAPRQVGVFKVFADQKAKRFVGLEALRLAEGTK